MEHEIDTYSEHCASLEHHYRGQGDFDSARYCQEVGKLWRDYGKRTLTLPGIFRGLLELRFEFA